MGVDQIVIVLILANLAMTYKGEEDFSFKGKYKFQVDPILIGKDYLRMISSGFLHSGWVHLIFNMYALYTFSSIFDMIGMPVFVFLLIYFGSLIGGNLFALYIHRNHGNYSAVGASGAVSGVIFSFTAIAPFATFNLFFFIPMIAWVGALLFIAYSIYGIKSQKDNIGHEAHLGGAITGLLITLIYRPDLISMYPWVIGGLLIPTAIFLYLIVTRPEILYIPGYWGESFNKNKNPFNVKKSSFKVKRGGGKKSKYASVEDEINALLDKGYANLNAIEKKRLEELSRKTDD